MSKRFSEITEQDLARYLRLDIYDLDDSEIQELAALKEVAGSYIKNYTGVKDLDSQAEFTIVTYLMVQDMFDNRALYNDAKMCTNRTVESILNMHSVNLI